MEFLPENISTYAEEHSSEESALLKQLERETHLKMLMPVMISGKVQGRFLSMISHLLSPKNVLEIGTFTGYSAICLAEGLVNGGKLITIDVNEEVEAIARKYINESPNSRSIELVIGDANELIPTFDITFDLVFIDADKENYLNYFELVLDKVRRGGIILADNVLWSGKVLDTETNDDRDTKALHQFNEKVSRDPRVENLLIPIRDGLMMLRKL